MRLSLPSMYGPRNRTSISQEFTVSFTIIIFGVTIVYIGKNSNA